MRSWPRRFDITGGRGDAAVYLTRWTLVTLFGWSLRLHLFRRPDADECLHDHPWPFWTLVLWGGYVERTPEGERRVRPFTLHYRPAEYRHRVARLPRGRALTIVLTGPKARDWGFWTRLGGWIYWREFVSTPAGERAALWCNDPSAEGGDHA